MLSQEKQTALDRIRDNHQNFSDWMKISESIHHRGHPSLSSYERGYDAACREDMSDKNFPPRKHENWKARNF